MTCQECEFILGMGEDAAEHLASCEECRSLAKELRLNEIALRGMWGPRPTPSSAFWIMATLAAAAIAFFWVIPREQKFQPPVRVTVSPPHIRLPPVSAKRAFRKPLPAEPLRVKMFTSDPDVVIYWIVDKKEGIE